MSAAKPESVAAMSKDALRASASASVAAHAASPVTAAASSSSSPFPSLEHELAAVKQQIAALEPKIDATEKRRDARSEDDPLWIRADDELKQLRAKEALLLKKEEQLRDEFKRKELALDRAGESHAQ